MIILIPIGEVEKSILEILKGALEETFDQETQVKNGIKLTRASWYERRRQYLASSLLSQLPSPPGSGDRVLGVVDVDIFDQGLNFIFGEADTTERKAIISLKRLRREFYGLPPDNGLFHERAIKEAIHELGHSYGLQHCPDPTCVMHFSNSLQDTDIKGRDFCPICRKRINQRLARESHQYG